MYKVLDTNILLLDAQNLINLAKDGSTIVIPETVLDEIDAKKSGHSEVAYQARQFGRLMAKASIIAVDNSSTEVITKLSLHNANIEVRTISNTFNDSDPKIRNDRRIIEAAKRYPVDSTTFISNDVACRLRAIAEGLKVSDFKNVEDVKLEFVKEIEVPPGMFGQLHNKPIAEVDLEYRPENFNYVFIDVSTGQRKLATLFNGVVQVLGKDSEKELRAQTLPPLNSGQLFLAKAIQDPTVDIVICEAKAGSGKTATALSNAMKLVRDSKTPYDGIVYIRSSVDDLEKAEEVGFLSGNDDKVAPYLTPLEDTLDFIARKELTKKGNLKGAALEEAVPNKIEELRTKHNIEAMISLGLRGRTFKNKVVIYDEFANVSKAGSQKALTRIGEGCKVILIGSNNQIDNPFLNKYTNGLSVLLDACRYEHTNVKLHAVSLPRVVRGRVAEFAENLYAKEQK